MGVYRRKDKKGKPYGPWIVQYPYALDPITGKLKYTSEKAGQSKRLAERTFAKKMLDWEKKKHLGLETKKEYAFRELIDWYLDLPKVKEKRSYNDDLSRSVILKEAFGNHLAHDIKPAMVEAFQHELLNRKCQRKKTKVKPASVNRVIALMKRVFNLAVREEFVDRNPCFKVSMLSENNKRDRVLTKDEFESFRSFLPLHAARIVTTAYYTGMRAGEIFGLTWNRVHLKEWYIELEEEDTKTSEPRRIYLAPVLEEMFQKLSRVRHIRHDFVFTYRGEPIKEIKGAFRRACKKAGIKDFRFHDLRHTFNTNMRKAGVDRSVIMKITGHKTLSMFERYNTIDKDDAHEAIKKLDDFLTKPSSSGAAITSILLQEPDTETTPHVTH